MYSGMNKTHRSPRQARKLRADLLGAALILASVGAWIVFSTLYLVP